MGRSRRRWIVAGAVLIALAVGVPAGLWLSLTHEPEFYRELTKPPPPERRRIESRQFVTHSMQLRNDVVNEPTWEAAFTAEEVNAWLAEDLVEHFADHIPRGVREPRVIFEPDRVTLAFQLEQGAVRSVVWIVCRVRVPEPNVLALTLEKIRAGVLPVPPQRYLEGIGQQAARWGVQVRWEEDNGLPVALIHYQPSLRRRDIRLERLHVLNGSIRLMGRSEDRPGDAATLVLPRRQALPSASGSKRSIQPARGASSRIDLGRVNVATPRR